MAHKIRTRLLARHMPRIFSQQHMILHALRQGHINRAITSHHGHLRCPPRRGSRRSRYFHRAPPVRSLHLQPPSIQTRSRPRSALRAAPIHSPRYHSQFPIVVMGLERHRHSQMLELGPSSGGLWVQETKLIESKAMEVDEEVRTLKEQLEAIQQEHAELGQKQTELQALLSVLLEIVQSIKSRASKAGKCDDICLQPTLSLHSCPWVMGSERSGHVHVLELNVLPGGFMGQTTSFVEVMRKFSEQIEEVRTLKEGAQAIRQSNAELRVKLESLISAVMENVKALQNQLPNEHLYDDACATSSHMRNVLLPIDNSIDQKGPQTQHIGSSSLSCIVPHN